MSWKYYTFVILLINFSLSSEITVEEFTTLTEKQKMALDQLRLRVDNLLVKDYTKEDQFLVRWLRESDFNVDFAEKMVLDNLKFRKDQKIDGILEEDFSDIDSEYVVYMEGCDRDGVPMMTLPLGKWDVRRAVVAGKSDRLIRYVYYVTEYCISIMTELQARGENVTHISSIFDLENMNAVQHGCPLCLSFYIQVLLAFQTRYPGYLNKSVIVNSPQFFIPAWNSIRRILNPKIRDLFFLFGRNKGEWQRELLKTMDKSALSKRYGGERESGIDGRLIRKTVEEGGPLYSCNMLPSDLFSFKSNYDSEEIFN